jgi:hypothetical protein
MRNDIFNPKLQEHYRLQTALQFIVILEAKLGANASRIAQLEDDMRYTKDQAHILNEAVRDLPLIKFRNWIL